MSKPLFGRMIPAMVTPFDENGELDLDRAGELAVWLSSKGSDSLVISGTTGESPTLSHSQKITLFQAVLEAVGDRCSVIANVGSNATAESVAFAREVERLGVAGIMSVVPYYNKPPQEGLFQHFRCIAHAVELPLILYNIPGRCVINMEADTTLRLAHECHNIVAIKEASGMMDQISAIIEGAPRDFAVYSGDDAATFEIMKAGGVGVISTIGNVAPARMKAIVNLCADKNWEAALSAHRQLEPLMKGLFAASNPILVKEALRLIDFPVGGVRLPLVNATDKESQRLAHLMHEVGVIN